MISSKFHIVFSALSNKVQQQFATLLQCSSFNKRKKLIDLFNLYLNDKDQSLEANFQILYPNRLFDHKLVHSLIGALYKQLLRFLAWKEMEANSEEEVLYSLQALRKLNVENAFEAEAKRIKKRLQSIEYKNEIYFFTEYALAREEDYYLTQRQIREQTAPLQARLDALDNFYLGAKFALSAEALSRNQIIGDAYQSSWIEPLGELYDEQPAEHMKDSLWLQVQRMLLRCLEEPDEEAHYHVFVQLLEKHQKTFPVDTARYLYKSAQNYCIRQINAGNTRFQKELLALFQKMLDQKLLIDEGGHISHSDVKNIVTVALRQGEYDWAKSFIDTYSPKVKTPQRDNVQAYCLALLDSYQEKPQSAIRRLREVQFTDVMYDLSARRLTGQIFFEQEDWEGIFHHLNAFEQFLRRQKQLSSHNRNSHLNYVRILRAMSKLREKAFFLPQEKIQAQQKKLRERIMRTEPLAYREWLLGQVKGNS